MGSLGRAVSFSAGRRFSGGRGWRGRKFGLTIKTAYAGSVARPGPVRRVGRAATRRGPPAFGPPTAVGLTSLCDVRPTLQATGPRRHRNAVHPDGFQAVASPTFDRASLALPKAPEAQRNRRRGGRRRRRVSSPQGRPGSLESDAGRQLLPHLARQARLGRYTARPPRRAAVMRTSGTLRDR